MVDLPAPVGPLLDVEVDVLENRRAFRVVTENDVVEVDVAADAAQRDGVRRVGDGRRDVERLENALQVRGAGDQLVVEVADVDDRIPEVVEVGDERDERAGADVQAGAVRNADVVDPGHCGCGDEFDDRPDGELVVLGDHP